MNDNLSSSISNNLSTIDQISKIIGERESIPENLLEKCKGITDWNVIVEHQKLLKEALKRDITIQAALLDYILSKGSRIEEDKPLEISTIQKTAYTSIIDPITGLYNNKYFNIIVEAELKKAKQYSLPLTIMMLDMDNFGNYMALYGHEMGDVALNEVSIVFKNNCRKEDMIFRLQKNRFAILLLNISREGSHKFAERLRVNIEEHNFKGADKLPLKKITISGGIAVYPDDGKNSQTLIIASEEALNTAKQSGRNRILEYSIKRRQTPRISIEIEGKYQIEGRKDLKPQLVTIKNISESGILIAGPNDLPLGGIIVLTFKLPVGSLIKIKGEAVRISRKEGEKQITIALKFTDILPLDLLNLRTFIEQQLTKSR
jgi:diguanylate cyclase (GGDEF)-like protein